MGFDNAKGWLAADLRRGSLIRQKTGRESRESYESKKNPIRVYSRKVAAIFCVDLRKSG
jgi:hypothetical protein